MINRILVMTDFSDTSANALKYALSFSKHFNASVYVLHVDELPLTYVSNRINILPYNKEKRDKEIQKSFDSLFKKVSPDGKEKYTTIIKTGILQDEMDELIRLQKIDLAIMGTVGKSFTEKLIIGSNTAEVSRKIRIPLMVIPEKSGFKPYENVVYATDYSEPDFSNIARLFFVAEKFKSELTVLHVKSDHDNLIGKSDSFFHRNKSKISYKKWKMVRLREADIVTSINHYLKKEKSDLLIMSRHHYSFFNRLFHISVCKKMIYNTRIPLMVLNE